MLTSNWNVREVGRNKPDENVSEWKRFQSKEVGMAPLGFCILETQFTRKTYKVCSRWQGNG
jgi:hypothetical protein